MLVQLTTYLLCLADVFFNRSRHTYGYQLCSPSCRLVIFFVRGRLLTGAFKVIQKKLAQHFNFTFRYIDDVLSVNNYNFGDFVDRIYPIQLEI